MRRRLHAQRLTGEPFESVAEAVRRLGAVQAQEFAEVKWSLAERTNERTDAAVEAAFARGDVIRTHVLRPTWHLVAREDVRWLLRLSRPRVHAANALLVPEVRARRAHAGPRALDPGADARRRAAHPARARRAPGGRRDRGRRAAARLPAHARRARGADVQRPAAPASSRPTRCSTTACRRAPLDDRPPEQALEDLVLRYFTVHGPATRRRLRRLVGLHDHRDASRARIPRRASRAARTSGTPRHGAPAPAASTGAFLIPMYDETIVAYKDLRVVLAHPLPAPRDARAPGRDRRPHGRGAGGARWRGAPPRSRSTGSGSLGASRAGGAGRRGRPVRDFPRRARHPHLDCAVRWRRSPTTSAGWSRA